MRCWGAMLVHLGHRLGKKKRVSNHFSSLPPWHHYMKKEAWFRSGSGSTHKERVDLRQITKPLWRGVSKKLQ